MYLYDVLKIKKKRASPVRNNPYPVKTHFLYDAVIAGESCTNARILENQYYFMCVRDYDDNDTFSKINWNATATMGRMMSSIYEDRRLRRVQLVCEFPDMYVTDCDAVAEKMITAVCSIYKSLMS